MKFKPDWFLLGMVVATALAWVIPDPGAQGGILHPELLTKGGVALIFFLHGIALSFENLKAGTMRWPVHMVVQGCTFLLFPLIGLALLKFGGPHLSPKLGLGFFYLCALPSTVSSSVAMTAAARGNVAVAVFNATLSSLIGVFLTPLWVGAVLETSGGGKMELGKVILDLIIWLVLPLTVGQLARPWFGAWFARRKKYTQVADRLTILLLVYTSFCDSVKWGVWSGQGTNVVVGTIVGSAVIFFAVLAIVGAVCDALGFSRADRIAAVFCGSKKTLASGIPMAHLIFGKDPGISLILLPIMIYHPLQLLICGWLAGRWAQQTEADAPAERELMHQGSK